VAPFAEIMPFGDFYFWLLNENSSYQN